MARRPEAYRRIHAAADAAEARFRRAFTRAAARARARLRLEALAAVIARGGGDTSGLDKGLGETFKPLGEILRDAYMRGGREGARVVNG